MDGITRMRAEKETASDFSNKDFEQIHKDLEISRKGDETEKQMVSRLAIEKIIKQKERKGKEEKKGHSPIVNFFLFIGELALTIILAFAVVLIIKKFAVQPFFVDGISMEPNFHNNEYLIINEMTYRWNKPERGDVIVFKYPLDEEKYYIKRIIGLPGETVKVKEGNVHICKDPENDISCEVLDETVYLPDDRATNHDTTMTLSDAEYFVLGDNRGSSSDSRYWGALEENEIIGKVWVRAWPLNKIEVFD
jgi:signal peptidase I